MSYFMFLFWYFIVLFKFMRMNMNELMMDRLEFYGFILNWMLEMNFRIVI